MFISYGLIDSVAAQTFAMNGHIGHDNYCIGCIGRSRKYSPFSHFLPIFHFKLLILFYSVHRFYYIHIMLVLPFPMTMVNLYINFSFSFFFVHRLCQIYTQHSLCTDRGSSFTGKSYFRCRCNQSY